MKILLLTALLAATPDGGKTAAAVQESQGYLAKAVVQDGAMVGEPATRTVSVEARGGFHVNAEYPMNFQPEKSASVDYAKKRFDKADGLEFKPCAKAEKETCRASLPVKFVAKAEGPATLSGVLAFSVCTEAQCLIEKVPLTVTRVIRAH